MLSPLPSRFIHVQMTANIKIDPSNRSNKDSSKKGFPHGKKTLEKRWEYGLFVKRIELTHTFEAGRLSVISRAKTASQRRYKRTANSARATGGLVATGPDPGVAGAAADVRFFRNFTDRVPLERKVPDGRLSIVVVAVEVLRNSRKEAVFAIGAAPVARRVRRDRQTLRDCLVTESLLKEFESLLTNFSGKNAGGQLAMKSVFQRLIDHCVEVSEREKGRWRRAEGGGAFAKAANA